MSTATRTFSRPRIVLLVSATTVTAILFLPWTASLGTYGVLMTEPQRLVVIRASESATVADVLVRPGADVGAGTPIARLQNLELEEQIADVEAQLARAVAEYHALEGQLAAGQGVVARAHAALEHREEEFAQVDHERHEILGRLSAARIKVDAVPGSDVGSFIRVDQPRGDATARYPAAIAAIQAEADARQIEAQDAAQRAERARRLFAQGLLPRAELAAAEMHASSLAKDLEAAHERLAAALVGHRHRFASVRAELRSTQSDVRAGHARIETLRTELVSMRTLQERLEHRHRTLQQKRAALSLLTPRAGIVLGDDMPRLVGQYVPKGTEVCRIADTSQLLLRVPVSEREVGDVRVGNPVRVRTPLRPGLTYPGVVLRISDEAIRDDNGRVTLQVELTIDNHDRELRPGMTAFARVDFQRWNVGRILVHKVRQILRQEIWML